MVACHAIFAVMARGVVRIRLFGSDSGSDEEADGIVAQVKGDFALTARSEDDDTTLATSLRLDKTGSRGLGWPVSV